MCDYPLDEVPVAHNGWDWRLTKRGKDNPACSTVTHTSDKCTTVLAVHTT